MRDIVHISDNCLVTLIASLLETPHKEVGGFLIGRDDKCLIRGNRTDCISLETVHPVQTAKSGKSYWAPGNMRAYRRIIDSISAMGLNIVGEYHSHVENVPELSEEDKEYIEEELDNLQGYNIHISYWIEIVLNIQKQVYTRKQKQKSTCRYLTKKVVYKLKNIRNPYIGYTITIGTYSITLSDHAFREVKTHIP